MLDREHIQSLIADGAPLASSPDAPGIVTSCVREVYIKAGLHRRMTGEQLTQEVALGAGMLLKDISSDRMFRLLRTGELAYCFDCGLKGRLGQALGDVSYRTLVSWIEAYVNSPERRGVQEDVCEERRREKAKAKLAALPAHAVLEDIAEETRAAYREYRDWRDGGGDPVPKPAKARRARGGGPVSIGAVLGVPISCRDFGRRKIRWLQEHGFAFDGETLMDAFGRMYADERRLEPGAEAESAGTITGTSQTPR